MDLLDFNKWFQELSRFSALAGILFFLFAEKKDNKLFWILFLILAASFLADSGNYFFIRLIYPNSYIISNSWYIVNFVLCIWLFYRLVPSLKAQLAIALIIFSAGALVSFLFVYQYTEANTFTKLFTSVALTYFPIWLYIGLLKNPSHNLKQHPVFWIANALFIYGSITLLKNLFQNYLVFSLEIDASTFSYVHAINLLANISKNFIFFYVLILIDKGYPDTLKPTKVP